jgi:S-layer protein (TIGR01567 family)
MKNRNIKNMKIISKIAILMVLFISLVAQAGAFAITDYTPTDGNVEINVSDTQEFTIELDEQASEIKWLFDDVEFKSDTNVNVSSWTVNQVLTDSTGTYDIEMRATKNTSTILNTWTLDVVDPDDEEENNSDFYESGYLIWDEDKAEDGDISYTYTWTPKTYSGFYYDINDDSGTEVLEITITEDDRTIEEGNIEYQTGVTTKDFECSDFGEFGVISFMAEDYFAAYIDGSDETEFVDDEISLIDNGILSKVLINDDKEESYYTGNQIELEEGYAIEISQVDSDGDMALISTLKDGKIVDSEPVDGNDTYVYECDIGNIDDVPLIAIHIDNIFSGSEASSVFIDGVFQISDDYIELDEGDSFGELEITNFGNDEITLSNEDEIELSKDETINLMGKVNLIVADDSVLRFAPMVDHSEDDEYELRGSIYDENDMNQMYWDAYNFIGFCNNIDDISSTESIEIDQSDLDGRDIEEGGLEYKTESYDVDFENSHWGEYKVIGFMTTNYFAGLEEDDATFIDEDIDLMSKGILCEVLIDSDDEESYYSGNSIKLEEGYELCFDQIDEDGDNVLVSLQRNGETIDVEPISDDETYVYKTDIGECDDVPLIAVEIGNIFSGTETGSVFTEGIFQISEEFTELDEGDSFGEMEIASINGNSIVLKNEEEITLSEDEVIDLFNGFKFKVADSDDLRFYPFLNVENNNPLSNDKELEISIQDKISIDDAFLIHVLSNDSPVKGADIKIDGTDIGTTDEDGVVTYTADEIRDYEITVSCDGYESSSLTVPVLSKEDADTRTSINVTPESDIYPGDSVQIHVYKTINNESLENVSIKLNGNMLENTTNEDGLINIIPESHGTYHLIASLDGYDTSNTEFVVNEPKPIVSCLDMDLPEKVTVGDVAPISVNITNIGHADGENIINLYINDNLTDSKCVYLNIGEHKNIVFNHTEDEPGQYNVTVGEIDGSYTVENDNLWTIIVGLFSVIFIIGIILKNGNREWNKNNFMTNISRIVQNIKDEYRRSKRAKVSRKKTRYSK